jgi:hypothetical protein
VLRSRPITSAKRALLAWLLIGLSGAAAAHEIRPAIVTGTFEGDGSYRFEVSLNLEALIAGISPVHVDTNESPNARHYDELRALPPAELKAHFAQFESRFLAGVTLEFDGQRAAPSIAAIEIPEAGDIRLARLSRVVLAGRVPEEASALRWAYAAEFGSNVLRLRRHDDSNVFAVWLKDGALSEPFNLAGAVVPKTRAQVVVEYTALGFTHILPLGLDHILFVLGLFLLSLRVKPLLIQVTAFTVAHTITLALSIYGVVSLSPTVVEPLIAASIVYVAVENILTPTLHAWRPVVVFLFGLLHGMGFAGVLTEVGLPRSEFVTGLLSFNVGVELGQLAVITLAYAAVGHWFKEKSWYRSRVVIPASALIALVGLYWTVERVLG